MDCQFLFHWLTKSFTHYEDFSLSHKNETLDEIKTSLENLWQRMIQLSEFFQYSFVLIPKRKCLLGASRVRCGESGTPSTIIYTRWSSRRYEFGCHAPMVMVNSTPPTPTPQKKPKTKTKHNHEDLKVICTSGLNLMILAWMADELWCGQTQNEVNLDLYLKFDL